MDHGKVQTGAPIICYITQADSTVIQVEVEHRAKAQEVLDKICRMLGVVEEAEYFGVQYIGGKNELLWLNNRNRLSRQISSQPPYHLYFKVKYYVPPEDLLLEGTRHQFYINVVHQLKEGSWDSDTSLSVQAQLIALMAYVQFGKFNQNTTPCKYACFWPDSRGEISSEALRLAANFHRSLDDFTVSHAQYRLLKTTYTDVPFYGMYFYEIKDIFEKRLLLGVGPEYLALCNSHYSLEDKFPYCRVHTITTSSRVVTLNLLEEDGSIKGRNYQLATPRLASALYRAVTEVYAFFRCDSVRKEVLLQTRRDLKDAITFHHNGKEYAFDVRYTFREVYDRARRHLYHYTCNTSSPPTQLANTHSIAISSGSPSSHEPLSHQASGDVASAPRHELPNRTDSVVTDEDIQEVVQKYLLEATLCRVCMDAQISRVFIPCGHIICCGDCADRIEQCSICRQPIEIRHPCFLPWNNEVGVDSQAQSECRSARQPSTRSDASFSASTVLMHTASAPTCNLFSLPSTACLSMLSSTQLESRRNPVTTSTGSGSGDEQEQTPAYQNISNDSSPSLPERSASIGPTSPEVPSSSTCTGGALDTAVRQPVHVTWQLE